tara:strand:+ start:4268 stop:5569 length:1302 start_codon:yes stop_codon:yes gene_type:complete
MSSIKDKIISFVENMSSEEGSLKFLYNRDFDKETSKVYYSGPFWSDDEVVAALTSFLSGKWLSSGESVYKFEKKLAEMYGQRNAVMVNSGSSANLVMIASLKNYFKWDDESEIIVSVVGFPTTVSPITQNKLKPVFVDIEFDTLNFDLDLVESSITDKTKAIFVSPVLGNPPDMDRLSEIAEKYNILIIMDGCDSMGTKWDGKYLQEYSTACSYSFYPAHHITTGEGGAVTSNIEELISLARSFAWWGRDCYCVGASNLLSCGTCGKRFDRWLDNYDGVIDHKYVFKVMGYNLKPLDLQGAIGLQQLNKLDEIHRRRRYNKEFLGKLFESIEGVRVPKELEKAETSWFGLPIVCKDKEQKQSLVTYLEENRIQTRNYFAGNILLHPGYQELGNYNEYQEANKVLDLVFFIGVSPTYTDDTLDYIKEVVSSYGK